MPTSHELLKKNFKSSEHPYKKYEEKIGEHLEKSSVLLDAGCGRTAPILKKFIGKAQSLYGTDLEDPLEITGEIEYLKGTIEEILIEPETIDIVISRAVLEHIINPENVFKEINRILKPGGRFIFLVPNFYDYVSLLSMIIPNKYHKGIMAKTEGRKMEDVFPAYYKVNTYRDVKKIGNINSFQIESFEWLGQYPSSLMFNSYAFFLGTVYEKIISKFDLLKYLRGWLLVGLVKNS